MKYSEAIKLFHDTALKRKKVVLIGQGINDFKGMWGTTSNLHKKYPNRVIDTPIAEDSTAGICVGLALNGMYPINTHIRADFSLLAFNQLINLIAKYKYMFGGNFELPMLFRLVIGRSWGQGAQHSQSLQSLLAHIPGLTVIMPSNSNSLIESYKYAINKYKNPIISFEHRLLYDLEFSLKNNNKINPFDSYIARNGSDLTIIATSIMVLECLRAADYLLKFGVRIEVIDLNCISNFNKKLIIKSVKKTKHLIIADTSWSMYGVSSEISRIVLESGISLNSRPISLGMAPSSCPTSKALENIFYPDLKKILKSVIKQIKRKDIPLPASQSMTDFYKHFKGPF